MTSTVERHFETHRPVELYVENGRGRVVVRADDTTESRVVVTGDEPEAVRIEHDGDRIEVVSPHERGWRSDRRYDIEVVVPTSSSLALKVGSADVVTQGELRDAELKSGSGDLDLDRFSGSVLIETGSGDVRLGRVAGRLQLKSGSGDVVVAATGDDTTVSTGSGDVRVEEPAGPCTVKTGSGDLRIGTSRHEVSLATGSGDLTVARAEAGRVVMKGASGDVHVGVIAGTPVWSDITTVTGTIHSSIRSAGQPREGEPYVELHARTVSGDITVVEA